MAQRILIILVILSVSFLLAESHWWRHRKRPRHGHCPSRDDENHECCDWEIKTYQQTIKYCRKCKVTPTNSSDICYYRARRHRYKQGCVVSFKYNVTEATCTPKCCEGWTRDEYGQCSIETDANTQEIVCENGGSPADDYCYCPDGFSGKHCESAVCTPHCLNNGICSGRDGEAICICPDGKYTGKQCETPVCDPACQNGGSCIDGIYRPMCSCPPGYEGESCEKEVKDGDCPAPSGSGICAEMCKTDSECPNEQKCCRNGCYAHQCMAPAATTCTYQGEQYPVGHRLQNNSCTTCVCKDPNSKNQWECVSISCPRLQCYKTKMIPNLCCPVCDDVPTTKAPTTTTTPLRSTCIKDGIEYPEGSEVASTDNCNSCICIKVEKQHPEWICRGVDCPPLKCESQKSITGQCCPVCDDKPPDECGPICKMYCKNGFQTDERGCPLCICKSTTTTTPAPTNISQSCIYDGEVYPKGHHIMKTDCMMCTCLSIYEQKPDWNCMINDCQQPKCSNPVKIPGQCCPVCPATSTLAPTTPKSSTCSFNGTQYQHRSTVKQTDCKTCVCQYQYGGYLNWSCSIEACVYCANPRMIPGQCCPMCNGTTPRPTTVRPTLPPNTGPSFKHCPSNTLIINTHREKFINIRRSVNLTVVDNSGTRYTIRYSKEIIEAIPCSCGKNIHIITAQSDPPDQYGRFASCHITVHVVDNHPPIYSSCPADIAAFEDEIISWDKPKATDNIGIKSEKIISDYENDSKFPEGTHVVMYVSVDHEGNVGVCRFLVAIYKRGSSDPTMPSELKKENRDNSKMNITLSVIGLLVGVVLLIAVVLWALYCRRMKKRRNEQTTGSESNAYNNEIYATTPTPKTPPPSYGKAGGMKLPPEYITGDDKPPMYEELDVKVFSKKGIHNPVYDTSVDLDAADIEVQVQKEECHQD
ncbi:cysteine-rich motor neuron 1 protein-like isoform X14 [Mytilus californianus]|uniref:cysteine-rich motor neuron 1 protein-like isoform X14 n=1 Tax=Mytilus californianus TaxID=6549 RepID=UPI002245DBF7|nr:cysteine-rich motor neuron 1 protein-like isoform X14 [Mytilus californianus]